MADNTGLGGTNIVGFGGLPNVILATGNSRTCGATEANAANFSQITKSFEPSGAGTVGYGAGQWIYGDWNSTNIYKTTDHQTFTTQAVSDLTGTMHIVYANGVWILAPRGNSAAKFIRSTDGGATWSTSTCVGGASNQYNIAYGGSNIWVSAGDGGKICRSTDNGATWSLSATLAAFGSTAPYTTSYGGSKFVVGGGDGSTWVVSYSNSDGTSWTSNTTPPTGWTVADMPTSIRYGNGYFVMHSSTGKVATSTDAITWTNRSTSGSHSGPHTDAGALAYVDTLGAWMLGQRGKLAINTDPTATWTFDTVSCLGGNFFGTIGYVSNPQSTTTNQWVVGGGSKNPVGDSVGATTWVIGTGGMRYATSTNGGSSWTEGTMTPVSSSTTYGLANNGTTWMSVVWDNYSPNYVSNIVYTSSNGTSWTQVESTGLQYTTAPFIQQLAFANSRWFGSDSNGYIYYSADSGVNWSRSALPCSGCTVTSVSRVAYNGSALLSVGGASSGAGVAWRSTDGGANWTQQTNNVHSSAYTSVAGGDGKFVRASNSAPQYSSDGITWTNGTGTNCTSGMQYIWHNGLTGGSSLWVLAGTSRVCTSSDGVTWTDRGNVLSGGEARSIGYGNGTWIIGCTNGYIYKSTNGTTWTASSNGFGSNSIGFVAGDSSGKFVAIGTNKNEYSPDGSIFYSNAFYPQIHSFEDIAFGNSTFVMFSRSKLYTSTDASTWTERTAPLSSYGARGLFSGTNWAYVDSTSLAAYSSDLSTWYSNALPEIATSLVYGNSLYISTTYGYSGGFHASIYSSPDAVTWTARATNTTTTVYIRDVAYGGSTFVAVGPANKTFTSTNGTSWTANSVSFTGEMYTVTYGNGRFVAAGVDGAAYYSADGVTWIAATSDFGSDDIRDSEYYGGTFFLVGGDLNASRFSSSSDGITFTGGTSPFRLPIYSVAGGSSTSTGYGTIKSSIDTSAWGSVNPTDAGFGSNTVQDFTFGNNLFIAVGSGGAVSSSPSGTTWTSVTDSDFGATDIFAATYGASTYVIGGASGKIWLSSTGASNSWSNAASTGFGAQTIFDMAFGNSRFIAVGGAAVQGRIGYSADGSNYTSAVTTMDVRFNTVAYNGSSLFVTAGASAVSPYVFYTSADGATWTQRTSSNIPSTAYGLAHNGTDRWLMVGAGGSVATSTDGINWTNVTDADFSTTDLNDVYYGGGAWMIVGKDGKVFTSSTGLDNSWNLSVDSDVTGINSINSLAYATLGVAAANTNIVNPTLPPSSTCTITLYNPSAGTQNFTLTMAIPAVSGTGTHYSCTGNIASNAVCTSYKRPESSPPTNFVSAGTYAGVAPDLDGDSNTSESTESYSSTLTSGETKTIRIRYPAFPANITGEMKFVCQGTLSVEDATSTAAGFIQASGEIEVYSDESYAQQSSGSRTILGQYRKNVIKFNIGPGGKKEL